MVIKVLASTSTVGTRSEQAEEPQEELDNLLVDTLFKQAEKP